MTARSIEGQKAGARDPDTPATEAARKVLRGDVFTYLHGIENRGSGIGRFDHSSVGQIATSLGLLLQNTFLLKKLSSYAREHDVTHIGVIGHASRDEIRVADADLAAGLLAIAVFEGDPVYVPVGRGLCFYLFSDKKEKLEIKDGVWQPAFVKKRKQAYKEAEPQHYATVYQEVIDDEVARIAASVRTMRRQDRERLKRVFEEVELRDYQLLIFGAATPTKARFRKWLAVEGKDIANDDIPFIARAIQHFARAFKTTLQIQTANDAKKSVNVASNWRKDKGRYRYRIVSADARQDVITQPTTLPVLLAK